MLDTISPSLELIPPAVDLLQKFEYLSLVAMGGTYGVRMFTIACMCIFAMGTCIAATVPTSRPAGYSVTINSKVPTTVQVIATSNYVVSLEGGSPSCALTVRHFYSNTIAHLFWSATYYVGSLVGATQCTLTLTKTGDLQLFALFKGTNTMVWHSNTAGKGITHMALEDVFDSGDLQLLTAANKVVWDSFGVPEFAVLPTQKFT